MDAAQPVKYKMGFNVPNTYPTYCKSLISLKYSDDVKVMKDPTGSKGII